MLPSLTNNVDDIQDEDEQVLAPAAHPYQKC